MAPLPVLALAAAGMLAPAVCQRGHSRGVAGCAAGASPPAAEKLLGLKMLLPLSVPTFGAASAS